MQHLTHIYRSSKIQVSPKILTSSQEIELMRRRAFNEVRDRMHDEENERVTYWVFSIWILLWYCGSTTMRSHTTFNSLFLFLSGVLADRLNMNSLFFIHLQHGGV